MTMTKPCECGKRMILRDSRLVILTHPAKVRSYWWCGQCGRTEQGPIRTCPSEQDNAFDEWQRVNP